MKTEPILIHKDYIFKTFLLLFLFDRKSRQNSIFVLVSAANLSRKHKQTQTHMNTLTNMKIQYNHTPSNSNQNSLNITYQIRHLFKKKSCWHPTVDCLYLSLTLKHREVSQLFSCYYVIHTHTHESNNRSHFPPSHSIFIYVHNHLSPQINNKTPDESQPDNSKNNTQRNHGNN